MKQMLRRTKRQEAILSSLDKLGYVSRSQLQKIHDLKSDRNALKVMRELSGYTGVFRHGENVYHLNKNGCDFIGSTKLRKRTTQVAHYLLRNEIYIRYGCPSQWWNETPVEVQGVVKIKPDAIFTLGDRQYFVEVDNKQNMKVNRAKVDNYRLMKKTNAFQAQRGYFPKLIWITTTPARQKKLEAMCEGLECVFYNAEDGV